MRNISVVAANFATSLAYHLGAKTAAITGAHNNTKRVTKSSVIPSVPLTRLTNSLTAARLPCSRYSARIGTKAWANAPSANNRRKKFGILKATKNTSAKALAPITLANTISLAKPAKRDNMVKNPTSALERSNPVSFFCCKDLLLNLTAYRQCSYKQFNGTSGLVQVVIPREYSTSASYSPDS